MALAWTTGLAGESGLDLNYGAAPGLQLTAVLPAAYKSTVGRTEVGGGVVELAAKFRVLHSPDDPLLPDIAIFPRLFLPAASRGFGAGRANLLLPVWAGKDLGPWSVFGGGGYQINPGPGAHSFWTGGLVTKPPWPRIFAGGGGLRPHAGHHRWPVLRRRQSGRRLAPH